MARILVVDDDPAIRTLIRAVLADEGHEVQTADDGRTAVESVVASVPDLIVLDLAMPEMDGWRVLEELHLRGLRRSTRVVIVSANLDEAAVGRGRGEAVRHFLPKPFDPDDLVAMVSDELTSDPDELVDRRERTDSLVRLIRRVDEVMR